LDSDLVLLRLPCLQLNDGAFSGLDSTQFYLVCEKSL
jgi:hypothetical protein